MRRITVRGHMLLRAPLLAFTVISASCAATAFIVVEAQSPAVESGRVAQPIGIKTLGGVFTPILPLGCAVPCAVTNTFSTAEDSQREVLVQVYRGTDARVTGDQLLGIFAITGFRLMPRGQPSIAVTLVARGHDVVMLARDRSGVPLRIEKRST